MTGQITILLVDDEPNNLRALQFDLEDTGYQTVLAKDGQEAWECLEKSQTKISAILLDRMMPRMDGMQFMKKLKAEPTFSTIPVIMQTAAAEKEQVAQGIQAGVYYYMIKPYDKLVMLSVLEAAIRDYGQYRKLRESIKSFKSKLHLVRQSCFEIRSLEDTDFLATFLAQFFPDPERVVLGLSELIINALEHGNFGITYDEKTELNKQGTWRQEISRRQELPENKDKVVSILYQKTDKYIELTITDSGKGFDWKQYLEIAPERATDNHGRGIAISKMLSFDEMSYIGNGNQVYCKVLLPTDNAAAA